LNIPDTSGRDSLFQAESRRCKEIIDIINDNNKIGHRHFCVFDELFSGTNPEEASKAGHAFLKYLTKYENVTFILTTHYFKICKKFNKSLTVQNYKMEVIVREDGTFKYTYKIKKGISRIKGGIRVLKDMDFPIEIINTIQQ
jgi:DNA mismatch repair protein MutS